MARRLTVATATTFFVASTWLTVHGVGALWGGKSPIWASLIGTLVGTAVSAVFPPAVVVLPSLGATVGYHVAAR